MATTFTMLVAIQRGTTDPMYTIDALKRCCERTRAASMVPAMPLALSLAPGAEFSRNTVSAHAIQGLVQGEGLVPFHDRLTGRQ